MPIPTTALASSAPPFAIRVRALIILGWCSSSTTIPGIGDQSAPKTMVGIAPIQNIAVAISARW